MTRPRLSVCIPAYNRAAVLPALLDSVLAQDIDPASWECVIVEDASAERAQIRAIATEYAAKSGGRIRYFENPTNLGYDGNFRQLVARAEGTYLFIMGNDDLVHPGAFAAVLRTLDRYPDIGVILRAYAFFRGNSTEPFQVNRYYPSECYFPAGRPALLACYRRLVSMSGIVLHRDSALAVATDRFDGTLFYQHWLVGNILCERGAAYVPDLLVLFRKDGSPEFGNAPAERGRYTPGVQPPDTGLRMIASLFEIAQAVERERGITFVRDLRRDFANYMFPTFAHQSQQPWTVLWRFYRDLGHMGFDRYPMFHVWFWCISFIGAARTDAVIQLIRRRLGHTPNLTRAARQQGRPAPARPPGQAPA